MNDRGDKIVHLAYELLHATPDNAPAPHPPKSPITFKILCMATLLTALGSSFVTEWSHENARPLNRYEKIELKALIVYVAQLKGIDENHVRDDIAHQLNLPALDDMTQHEFLIARRYLQEKAQ